MGALCREQLAGVGLVGRSLSLAGGRGYLPGNAIVPFVMSQRADFQGVAAKETGKVKKALCGHFLFDWKLMTFSFSSGVELSCEGRATSLSAPTSPAAPAPHPPRRRLSLLPVSRQPPSSLGAVRTVQGRAVVPRQNRSREVREVLRAPPTSSHFNSTNSRMEDELETWLQRRLVTQVKKEQKVSPP